MEAVVAWTSDSPDTTHALQHLIVHKDIPIHNFKSTLMLIFLNRNLLQYSTYKTIKLPIIVHFHRGGFIIGAYVSLFLLNPNRWYPMHRRIRCIIVSVGYRLSPGLRGCYGRVAFHQNNWTRMVEQTRWVFKHLPHGQVATLPTMKAYVPPLMISVLYRSNGWNYINPFLVGRRGRNPNWD